MAYGDDLGMAEEGWQMQSSRKSRRQRAWLSQPANEATVGGRPAQSGGRRQLPAWLRREYEPPVPPWRSGGKGGGKQKERLLVLGTPGLFRVGPPSLCRAKRFPAATRAAQASAANSPSSISMLLDEGNMASTAWPATCHGRGPGKSISMDDPPRQGAPRGRTALGR